MGNLDPIESDLEDDENNVDNNNIVKTEHDDFFNDKNDMLFEDKDQKKCQS